MIQASTTFIAAILLSSIAAYFSIVGLALIFPSSSLQIMIMGTVLEISKIITASWLHYNWKEKAVSFLHKIYLVIALFCLMSITSLGIYGYLSKAHLDQTSNNSVIELQIDNNNNHIQSILDDINRFNDKLGHLDSIVQTLIDAERIRGKDGANEILKSQNDERNKINEEISILEQKKKELEDINYELSLKLVDENTKLGPLEYIAKLFEFNNKDDAVILLIILIMIAFDPLAILLIISASISYDRYKNKKLNILVEKNKIKKEYEFIESEKKRLNEKSSLLNNKERNLKDK